MERDLDFDWLVSHLPQGKSLKPREELAERVCQMLRGRAERGALPYTVGVFGGWGSGKTTFLALLAKKLEQDRNIRVVYFNSWKYAGFMEIVPSLIYKIMQYGVADTKENQEKAAMRVLLSLGKEYADKFGKWAEERVGVNVVDLFKDIHDIKDTIVDGKAVAPEVVKAYYTQVDKAQDVLLEVLGTVEAGKKIKNAVVVLVDELDRCDPDEAFNVIKQMRVLFAMRRLPVAFVMCANPEPIGLAIKHRYGLESASGDYESRRILEKFVDAYEDFTEPAPLGDLVFSLWNDAGPFSPPWIMEIDRLNGDSSYEIDIVMNANVFDIISTEIPYYANLRVIQKTYQYLKVRSIHNRHLIWTLWHLEIVEQVDPKFRASLRVLAHNIQNILQRSYHDMERNLQFEVSGKKIIFKTDKGTTLFAIFRSLFWEHGREELARLDEKTDPESRGRLACLQELLADHRKVNFVVSMCLLPFPDMPTHSQLISQGKMPTLGVAFDNGLGEQFGYSLSML